MGTLAAQSWATLILTGTVQNVGIYTNLAQVGALDQADPNSTNDLAEAVFTAVTTTTTTTTSSTSTTTTTTSSTSTSTSTTTTTSTSTTSTTTTSTTTTSTTTSSTTSTSSTSTTSTTSTTVAPPVIVDFNHDVTLWAVYTPTGSIMPTYSTNLETLIHTVFVYDQRTDEYIIIITTGCMINITV